jgi:hypothetical protein
MELKEIQNKLGNYKNGTFVKIKYNKPLSKGYTAQTEIISRLGCKYENLPTTTKAVTTKSDYAKAIDEKRILYKNIKSDQYYVQHEPLDDGTESRKVVYFKNGVQVNESTARAELPKSAFDTQRSGVKRLKIENIISIG